LLLLLLLHPSLSGQMFTNAHFDQIDIVDENYFHCVVVVVASVVVERDSAK